VGATGFEPRQDEDVSEPKAPVDGPGGNEEPLDGGANHATDQAGTIPRDDSRFDAGAPSESGQALVEERAARLLARLEALAGEAGHEVAAELRAILDGDGQDLAVTRGRV
jgi:hypothetical protein